MEPLVLTRAEAARSLKVGTTTLDELIAVGRIDTMKLGTRRLVKADSVRRFVEQGGAR